MCCNSIAEEGARFKLVFTTPQPFSAVCIRDWNQSIGLDWLDLTASDWWCPPPSPSTPPPSYSLARSLTTGINGCCTCGGFNHVQRYIYDVSDDFLNDVHHSLFVSRRGIASPPPHHSGQLEVSRRSRTLPVCSHVAAWFTWLVIMSSWALGLPLEGFRFGAALNGMDIADILPSN